MTTAPDSLSDDAFLGDALQVLQPKSGYRAGVDAVLLAASVATKGSTKVLDAGAGVGVVGLCVARRLSAARVTLLERDPVFGELARRNAERNDLSSRVDVVEADITARADRLRALGIADERFDVVLANPPYHDTARGTRSKQQLKDAAHAMPAGDLERWIRSLTRVTRAGGILTLIHRAEAVSGLLAAMQGRFGAITVKPIYARTGTPAIRVLVSGVKGSRAPLQIRPPLVLHATGNAFSAEAEAILRKGAGLPM